MPSISLAVGRSSHRSRRRPWATVVLAALFLLPLGVLASGCAPGNDAGSGDAEVPAAAGPRVENETLGLAIASLPAGWRVAVNEGNRLILERTSPGEEGTLELLLGPPQRAGVNLVDRVWEEKARIEEMPEGEYRGQNELGGAALGRIYTSRGRFLDQSSGRRIEEYRALAVHPRENRLLIVDYEYPEPPAEGGPNRLEQLMLVVQEIEGMGGAEAPEPEATEPSEEGAPAAGEPAGTP